MRKFIVTSLLSAGILASSSAFADSTNWHNPQPSSNVPSYSHHEGCAHLSADKQKMLDAMMQENRKEFMATHEQIHALRHDMAAIFNAPQFDQSAFLAKHQQIVALREKLANDRAARIATLASQFTPEERGVLLHMMHKHHHHHGHHHHWDHDDK